MRRAYFEDFEKRYGIRVVETSPADFGKLRAMVDSGNVEWTVTEIGGQDAIRAGDLGLVEKIDDSIVDRSQFPADARAPTVFTSSVYSTVLAYRTDEIKPGSQPKGWAEFWDAKKFPGPRSLRNHPVDNLEFALIADGVPKDKLYPLDMDRAFRKLDQIKPHVTVWWTTGAQPAQLLLDGEVVMATGWNGRFFDLMQKKAPIGLEWTEGALKQGTFVIPRGAKAAYWGQKMLALMAEPKGQAIYASALGYPGLHPEAAKLTDAKVLPFLPTAPENLPKQFWISDRWWAENGSQAIERWNGWMLKK
jgi:putative spermidine/putrescine transport system substrate-binding protein